MSKDLFFQVRESEQLNQDAPIPTEYLIIYPFQREKPKQILVVGCNYHTTWQKHPAMRFVLKEIDGKRARLVTRETKKDFWTNVEDLIFIETRHNKQKAIILSNQTNGKANNTVQSK